MTVLSGEEQALGTVALRNNKQKAAAAAAAAGVEATEAHADKNDQTPEQKRLPIPRTAICTGKVYTSNTTIHQGLANQPSTIT